MPVHVVAKGDAMPPDTQYVVYDLEMVDATHVWNVAMANLYRPKRRIEEVAWPGIDPIPPPPHEDLVVVTRSFLEANGARAWAVVGANLLAWLSAQRPTAKSVVVLVAHGNFCFDKPVLERAFGREGVRLPSWLVFMDTLPILRRTYPGLSAYSLGALHRHALGGPIPRQHTAMADVNALMRVLARTNLDLHA